MKTSWFVATVITRCEVMDESGQPDRWTCSQNIYLVRAPNREIAYEKACRLGKSEEVSYLNMYKEKVTWTFVGLENLEELSEQRIHDGIEIWSRIFETNDPDALVPGKEGLSVYYDETIRDVKVEELLENDPETKLVCNRVRR